MSPELVLAALGAVLGPLAGIFTGWLLDRRSKGNAKLTHTVAEKDATTHQWEVLSSGMGEYIEMMERKAARLEARVVELEKQYEALAEDWGLLVEHVGVLEKLAPIELRPARPKLSWRKAS